MADEKIKISELDAASQSEFTDDALLALDVEDQNSETGYSTKSGLLSRLIAYIKTKLGIEDLKNVNITTSDNNKLLGVSVADNVISVGAVSGTDIIKIISNNPWSSETTITTDTEYNSSSPVTITGIPSGYQVIGVANAQVKGYYGSRGVAYAWLEDSTHYSYSIYNAANRDIKVILTVWFICVKI